MGEARGQWRHFLMLCGGVGAGADADGGMG
jgi:hypothetical protein